MVGRGGTIEDNYHFACLAADQQSDTTCRQGLSPQLLKSGVDITPIFTQIIQRFLFRKIQKIDLSLGRG